MHEIAPPDRDGVPMACSVPGCGKHAPFGERIAGGVRRFCFGHWKASGAPIAAPASAPAAPTQSRLL